MNAPIKFSTQKGEGGTVGYSVMTILLLYRLLTAATHGEHEIFFFGSFAEALYHKCQQFGLVKDTTKLPFKVGYNSIPVCS